jgi:hypothetical protein
MKCETEPGAWCETNAASDVNDEQIIARGSRSSRHEDKVTG